MGKYLAAIDAVEDGYGNTPEELRSTLRLLWCQSRDELALFEPLWEEVLREQQIQLAQAKLTKYPQTRLETEIMEEESNSTIDASEDTSESETEIIEEDSDSTIDTSEQIAPLENLENLTKEKIQLDFVPVRAPKLTTIEDESSGELQQDFPISRRYMAYSWRRLRRLIPLGVLDVLDVEATVSTAAKQGFYLKPSYRRREINCTHLLLFVDREGSMIPFHRFVRNLVDAALEESGIEQVNVFYFRNVFEDTVFYDEYLTKFIALKPIETTQAVLADCDHDTIVIIVSDGGAARGHDSFERFHASTEFLFALRQEVDTIVWLNPLPQERWRNTSAAKIASSVPMYPLDPEGLSAAIDRARGQTTSRQR
ncbi:VWA containing CoxE family protein [Microcoleus sp. SVA1_A1]